MKRPTKDEYYLQIAKSVSERSTCLKRQYGCVIVNNDEVIATGYNGNPRGKKNCCEIGYCGRLNKPHNSGDYSDCQSVHAEQNAMISASRKDMLGAKMYLYGKEELDWCSWEDDCCRELQMVNKCHLDYKQHCLAKKTKLKEIQATPCPICLRMIKNAGISEIIGSGGVHIVLDR